MNEQRIISAQDAATLRNLQFHSEEVNAGTEYLAHNHPWGQLICVKSGVLALSVAGRRFLAPPEFAIWLPAGVEHSSYNRRPSLFRTINIARRLCVGMPQQVCLLNVGPLVYAILENCFSRGLVEPRTRPDLRLCRTLVDQLKSAPVSQAYLPSTEDKFLAPILNALERCPSDATTLAQWAQRVYTTERTLSRRCQQELGMSFSEWRQRLRFLHSLSLLEQGKSVQEVALEVGYSSASAFIAMFQQIGGTTPERYRHHG